ncbi:restriction endonuclease subunit S [Jinshanibacter sp. LJY008]|uniref:Restriction endonuclease subunit S n=1 Tax=Limnobaculum eriocheiris TaxID=2897391 RepID=A0A9X1SNN6_9GAMM|nr:restriction endonuclease subunit S [Limnobaculum eriocheiris]MCD1125212.1 restriction endonuclease subunit S [Limnobaculum eriocheiris]
MSSKVSFSHIAEIVMGQSPKAEEVNNKGIGLPLLNGPTEFTDRYPIPVQHTTYAKKTSQPGDILFCVRGSTTGRMNYSDQKYCIGRGLAAVRGRNGYPTPYVKAILETYLPELLAAATGSTFPNVSKDLINNISVEVLPVENACNINKLIKSQEEKVSNNNQINQTLEQMVQALFKSWFVDFEPVKAKITVLEAGGSQEEATLAAMTAISGKGADSLAIFEFEQPEKYAELKATAELFPSDMQNSELGEIPVGWESSSLSKKIKLIGGGTPKRSESSYWGGDICWYSVKDAPNSSDIFVIDTVEKITVEGLNKSSTRLLPVGTTIISARGTVGKLALSAVETAMNQSCYGISGEKFSGPFLTYLKVKQCIDALKKNTHGAVFDTITTNTFDTVNVLTASKVINDEFEKLITPLFNTIKSNLISNSYLSQLRDTLLPKLLSGEITLPEAEHAVSEVANV